MRINPVNNNCQNPQSQQSFGAIRGSGMIKREVIHHLFRPNEERLIRGDSFDKWLTRRIEQIGLDADGLEKLAKEQAELAKKGEDFKTKFDRLRIEGPRGEVINPIINYNVSCIAASRDNINYVDSNPQDLMGIDSLDKVFKAVKNAADNLAYRLRNVPEFYAEKLQVAKNVAGINNLTPQEQLANAVYKDFAKLSGIPEEQAQVLLSTLINKLKTPNGKMATPQELLETVKEAGLIQPQLTKAEESSITAEVDAILPPVPNDDIREMQELKKRLQARG